ncbi:MAG: DUF4373 domain-containing protein [Bacteroidaceae bacterium]|nr:DUF4373 domain-containing protein [Bacteroidaceae bacterium]
MKRDQYFPHEVNLRQTSEFMHLIEKEGMAGYGIYWGLIEYLRSQDNYTGDFKVLKTLARQMRTKPVKLETVLRNYGLFTLTDYTFSSAKLSETMMPLENKRKELNGQNESKTETKVKQTAYNSLKTNTHSDTVKKSKVKKSKENTSSAEETAVSTTPTLSIRLPWETFVDELDKEQQWKEIMAMRSGLKKEFFTLYPRIIDGFKEHVRALGKESAILSSSDAKRYFCCYFTPGSYTYQQLMVQLKQPDKNHNPFEERDTTTGQRSYCGVPIPDDAPPRPNAQAAWNSETKQWKF